MNGVLTSFVLFLCSWRFLFYITAFFTGLAVLYDVSTPAVPPAVPPASTWKPAGFVVIHVLSDLLIELFPPSRCVSSAQHAYQTTDILACACFKNSSSKPRGFLFFCQSRRKLGLCENTFLGGRSWNTDLKWRLQGLFVCCKNSAFLWSMDCNLMTLFIDFPYPRDAPCGKNFWGLQLPYVCESFWSAKF